jgi:hypothetical protein
VTFQSLPNATFSLELAAGQLPLDLPVGQTIDLFGPAHHLANHLALLETKKEPTTIDTSGQHSLTLLESKRLQRCLANKLQAQLGTDGSMIYKQTWKTKTTPAQWQFCQLVASAHRKKEIACGTSLTSWPTPTTIDNPQVAGQGKAANNPKRGTTLGGAARLAQWPTPMYSDGSKACNRYRENNQNGLGAIASTVEMGAWATPTTRDYKCTGDMENYIFGSPTGRVRTDMVPTQAFLIAPWPTSSTVETEKPVQPPLNPRFSLWLMGYPIEWAYCAERVTPLSRKSRPKS